MVALINKWLPLIHKTAALELACRPLLKYNYSTMSAMDANAHPRLILIEPENRASHQFSTLKELLKKNNIPYHQIFGFEDAKEYMADRNSSNMLVVNNSLFDERDIPKQLFTYGNTKIFCYPKQSRSADYPALRNFQHVVNEYNGKTNIKDNSAASFGRIENSHHSRSPEGKIRLKSIKKDLAKDRYGAVLNPYRHIMIMHPKNPNNQEYKALYEVLKTERKFVETISAQNELKKFEGGGKALVVIEKEAFDDVSRFIINQRLDDNIDIAVLGFKKGFLNKNHAVASEKASEIVDYINDSGIEMPGLRERLDKQFIYSRRDLKSQKNIHEGNQVGEQLNSPIRSPRELHQSGDGVTSRIIRQENHRLESSSNDATAINGHNNILVNSKLSESGSIDRPKMPKKIKKMGRKKGSEVDQSNSIVVNDADKIPIININEVASENVSNQADVIEKEEMHWDLYPKSDGYYKKPVFFLEKRSNPAEVHLQRVASNESSRNNRENREYELNNNADRSPSDQVIYEVSDEYRGSNPSEYMNINNESLASRNSLNGGNLPIATNSVNRPKNTEQIIDNRLSERGIYNKNSNAPKSTPHEATFISSDNMPSNPQFILNDTKQTLIEKNSQTVPNSATNKSIEENMRSKEIIIGREKQPEAKPAVVKLNNTTHPAEIINSNPNKYVNQTINTPATYIPTSVTSIQKQTVNYDSGLNPSRRVQSPSHSQPAEYNSHRGGLIYHQAVGHDDKRHPEGNKYSEEKKYSEQRRYQPDDNKYVDRKYTEVRQYTDERRVSPVSPANYTHTVAYTKGPDYSASKRVEYASSGNHPEYVRPSSPIYTSTYNQPQNPLRNSEASTQGIGISSHETKYIRTANHTYSNPIQITRQTSEINKLANSRANNNHIASVTPPKAENLNMVTSRVSTVQYTGSSSYTPRAFNPDDYDVTYDEQNRKVYRAKSPVRIQLGSEPHTNLHSSRTHERPSSPTYTRPVSPPYYPSNNTSKPVISYEHGSTSNVNVKYHEPTVYNNEASHHTYSFNNNFSSTPNVRVEEYEKRSPSGDRYQSTREVVTPSSRTFQSYKVETTQSQRPSIQMRVEQTVQQKKISPSGFRNGNQELSSSASVSAHSTNMKLSDNDKKFSKISRQSYSNQSSGLTHQHYFTNTSSPVYGESKPYQFKTTVTTNVESADHYHSLEKQYENLSLETNPVHYIIDASLPGSETLLNSLPYSSFKDRLERISQRGMLDKMDKQELPNSSYDIGFMFVKDGYTPERLTPGYHLVEINPRFPEMVITELASGKNCLIKMARPENLSLAKKILLAPLIEHYIFYQKNDPDAGKVLKLFPNNKFQKFSYSQRRDLEDTLNLHLKNKGRLVRALIFVNEGNIRECAPVMNSFLNHGTFHMICNIRSNSHNTLALEYPKVTFSSNFNFKSYGSVINFASHQADNSQDSDTYEVVRPHDYEDNAGSRNIVRGAAMAISNYQKPAYQQNRLSNSRQSSSDNNLRTAQEAAELLRQGMSPVKMANQRSHTQLSNRISEEDGESPRRADKRKIIYLQEEYKAEGLHKEIEAKFPNQYEIKFFGSLEGLKLPFNSGVEFVILHPRGDIIGGEVTDRQAMYFMLGDGGRLPSGVGQFHSKQELYEYL